MEINGAHDEIQDPHSPPFRGTTYVPGSTVTRPLLDRYSTVTRPLRDRYATVTRPLHTFFMSYRYLPGTWARLCHIASRYLPVALRYKTSIFAYIPRDMYAEGNPSSRKPRPHWPGAELQRSTTTPAWVPDEMFVSHARPHRRSVMPPEEYALNCGAHGYNHSAERRGEP